MRQGRLGSGRRVKEGEKGEGGGGRGVKGLQTPRRRGGGHAGVCHPSVTASPARQADQAALVSADNGNRTVPNNNNKMKRRPATTTAGTNGVRGTLWDRQARR